MMHCFFEGKTSCKEKWVRIVGLFLMTVLFVFYVGLFDSQTMAANNNQIKSVKILKGSSNVTKKTISIQKGKSIKIKVKVTPKAAKKKVTLKSKNKKI